MFRSSGRDLLAARIAILVFAAMLAAAVSVPLQAAGVTSVMKDSLLSVEPQFSAAVGSETQPGETIRVPIWIPGFDDDEAVLTCSLMPTANVSMRKLSNHGRYSFRIAKQPLFGQPAGLDTCSGMLRMLPWISQPAPIGRVQFLLPMI